MMYPLNSPLSDKRPTHTSSIMTALAISILSLSCLSVNHTPRGQVRTFQVSECQIRYSNLKSDSYFLCTILRQGWVKKKTTNLFLGFQERYLVLYSNKKLVYYKLLKNKAAKYKNHWQIQSEDPSASTLSYSIAQIQEDFHKSGEFDLNLIAVNRISLSGPCRFELTFTGMLRQFLFQATSTQDAFDWKHTIETIANQIHIPEAMNRQSSLAVQSQNSSSLQNTFQVVPTPQSLSEMKMNIPVQRNFWKYARLCEEDFQKVADTGDIILFKAPDFACKMQRFITNSNYNHIAMILRSSTGSLKFIEATMQQGVEIIDWEIFVHYKCYRHFERVVYRRVGNFQRSKETLTKLEEFIKVAKNKRYSLAATKLLRKHCTNDSDISIKVDKTYFCSELVASLYKNMGLLPPDISASQYWPVNFSSRAGMKLLGGAFLDEEKLLEFNSVISGEGGNA